MDEGMNDGTPGTSRRAMVLGTVLTLLSAWAIAAGNTAIAYAALGHEVIPIATGVLFSFAFLIALRVLHQAWWLTLLAALPALLVVVGSVEYAPDAALERRGVRERVVISADEAQDSGGPHRFTLVGANGPLDERLEYRGDAPPYGVGDRIEIIRDPEGAVPLAEAGSVDSRGMRTSLVAGVTAWTLMVPIAGWRGHAQRRARREPLLERLGIM
ncbi:hypothetical protein AB0N23_03905 [Streptomyces sp. NPDC052644]